MRGTTFRQAAEAGRIAAAHAFEKVRELFIAMMCLVPPLYLSNRLPTLHTVTDNKWLVVVFLSACTLALTALGWATSKSSSGEGRPLPVAFLLGGVAVFAGAHLLSALQSRAPGFSLRAAIFQLALPAVFAALVWKRLRPQVIPKLLWVAVGTGAAVGACALAQHAGIDPLAGFARYAKAERYRTGVYATLGNPEYLGGYLTPLALVAAGLALASETRLGKAAGSVAALLAIAPALMTGSRGPFLGLVAGTVVLSVGLLTAARGPGRRRCIRAVSAAALFAVVAVGSTLLFPQGGPLRLIRSRLADAANPYSSSIRNRIVFNLVALEMVRSRPVFGVGPGMFGAEFYRAFYSLRQRDTGVATEVIARDLAGGVAEHGHDDWLEIWAETGTLGFAAWLWLLVFWALVVVRGIARESAGCAIPLVAVAAGTIALLTNALFNFPLHEPVRATLFWLFLAWSTSLAMEATVGPAQALSATPESDRTPSAAHRRD